MNSTETQAPTPAPAPEPAPAPSPAPAHAAEAPHPGELGKVLHELLALVERGEHFIGEKATALLADLKKHLP